MPPSAMRSSVYVATRSAAPSPPEAERRRVREFRRPAEAAIARVEARLQAAQGRIDRRRRELRVMRRRAGVHSLEGRENRLVLAADFIAVLAVDLRDTLEQLQKPRQVVARLLGEIRSAEERRAV